MRGDGPDASRYDFSGTLHAESDSIDQVQRRLPARRCMVVVSLSLCLSVSQSLCRCLSVSLSLCLCLCVSVSLSDDDALACTKVGMISMCVRRAQGIAAVRGSPGVELVVATKGRSL